MTVWSTRQAIVDFVHNQDGVCRKTIDRRRTVLSIAWLPGGEGECSTLRPAFP